MNEKKRVEDLTDKELKEGFQGFLKAYTPIHGKLTDEKIRTRITNKEIKSFREILEFFQSYGDKNTLLQQKTLPKDFKKDQEMSLFDDMLANMLEIDNLNPAEQLMIQINPKLTYEKIIPDEQYRAKLRQVLWQILFDIDNKKKLQNFNEFIKTMGLDNVYSHYQSAQRVQELIPYIMKERKRVSKRIAERYIDAYKEISGFMEPIIIILYGMKILLADNGIPSFVDIKKKKTIGKIVRALKNEPNFKILLEPYDPRIRNSLAHTSYHVDFLSKSIEFIDLDQKVTKSFMEFIEYVKEITRRAIILCHIEQEVQFLQFRAYALLRKK